jgi:hypothetical protein
MVSIRYLDPDESVLRFHLILAAAVTSTNWIGAGALSSVVARPVEARETMSSVIQKKLNKDLLRLWVLAPLHGIPLVFGADRRVTAKTVSRHGAKTQR